MGFFRRTEKQYTLGEAMKLLGKEQYESYMPIPINPEDPNTKYWIRKEEPIEPKRSFKETRNKFMEELDYDVKSKPGRVIRYNDYQSSKNYRNTYGSGQSYR